MAETYIEVGHEGAVGILTINRPHRFNSMDVTTARDFRRAALQLARDENVRCVVIRGTGKAFCSGADLKSIRAHADAPDFAYLRSGEAVIEPDAAREGFGEEFKEILEYLHSAISEIKRSPKPFIAAVNGVAAAGGFGIAMCCDLVYLARSATLEWAYHKTGLTGAESSTFFLPRLVGIRKAMELVLLNPRLSAEDAKTIGLITDVFDDGTFDADVLAVARRVASGPTKAYGVAKQLVNHAASVEQLDVHLDEELQHLARIADGAEFAEGLAAFFEKREADFSIST
ncbi:MAG TPA: enoyl-CoA hydratase-related protein [Gemmatimonadaceae bacterium]|nr:enoyl-CoA hydratase-related protein [Gemmatimonadaceae bacterium]